MEPKETSMENKKELTPEVIAKARGAKSPEELLALANESGFSMNEAGAKACFDKLHQDRALADEELENVAGGGCSYFDDRSGDPDDDFDPGYFPGYR